MEISAVDRKRTIIVFFSFAILYLIVLFNLFNIQILNRNFYLKLARDQHTIAVTTYPERAQIIDRNRKPITLNRDSVAAFILPHKLTEPQKLNSFLRRNFPDAYKRLAQHKNKYFMYIQRRLTPAQQALIKKYNLTDIKLVGEPSRFYLLETLAPVVGLASIDNQGLFGLERKYNKLLGGEPSIFDLEKDARSGRFYFKKATAQTGTEGQELQLTIDSELQFLAASELQEVVDNYQAQEGAVVILDPVQGDILALVSTPSFNPNQVGKLDLKLTKNRPISETHELGSVMKPFVALAALEEGVVTPDELIDCGGKKEVVVDGMRITTVLPDGIIPFWQVITRSNNIGMVKVAKKLGPKLYDYYRKMGFGIKTSLDLEGEQSGFVSHPKNWSKRSIVSLSFGYEISATLLQLAQAMGLIANNGYLVKPKLIIEQEPDSLTAKTGAQSRADSSKVSNHNIKRAFSEKTIQQMRKILQENVQAGTGKKAHIQGYEIFGKTGTANLVVDGKYSKQHNIYSFVGFVERGGYKRVIAVYVKDSPQPGLLASMVAAPLFEKIAEKMIIHDKLLN
ncbi:MAG TPA: penicillin-binding protein 2 [Candidatus Babeliales bacterium]|nr:penicillin-binding protein 2 [Candidatus Babeliales bacterium]